MDTKVQQTRSPEPGPRAQAAQHECHQSLQSQIAAQASALQTAVKTLATAEARAAEAEAMVEQALAAAAVSVEAGVSEIHGAAEAVENEYAARLSEQNKRTAAAQLSAERSRITRGAVAEIAAAEKLAVENATKPRPVVLAPAQPLGREPPATTTQGSSMCNPGVALELSEACDETEMLRVQHTHQAEWARAAWPKDRPPSETSPTQQVGDAGGADPSTCGIGVVAGSHGDWPSQGSMWSGSRSTALQACTFIQDSENALRGVVQARLSYEFAGKSFDRSGDVNGVSRAATRLEWPERRRQHRIDASVSILNRTAGIELKMPAASEMGSNSRVSTGNSDVELATTGQSSDEATGLTRPSPASIVPSVRDTTSSKIATTVEERLARPVQPVLLRLEEIALEDGKDDDSDESPPPSPMLQQLIEYCEILDELHRVIHVDTTIWMRDWRLRRILWLWCELTHHPQASMRKRVGGGFVYTTTHSFNSRELVALAKQGWTIHLV